METRCDLKKKKSFLRPRCEIAVKNRLSVNFVDMDLLINKTLNNTLRQFMKEGNHLCVNFVDMQLLIHKALKNISRQFTKEKKPFKFEVCGFATFYSQNLKRHMQVVHEL